MKKISINEKISILWIVTMLNMAFSDILTYALPESLSNIIEGKTEIIITEPLLLVSAIFVEIPIVMIFLSRFLKWTLNRAINITAAIITITFIISMGSLYLHYIFFAVIQIVCMITIIVLSIIYKDKEVSDNEHK